MATNGALETKAQAINGDTDVKNTKNKAADGNAKAAQRLAFVFKVLVGYSVQVQVKDGTVYEGIYSTAVPEGNSLRITLRFAKVIKNPNIQGELPVERPQELLELNSADIIQVMANDVRIGANDVGPISAMDDAGGFGTDAAISRGKGGREGRELERWVPDESESAAYLHLEDSVQERNTAGWDQFALNERKFGVRTNYNEEFYTTKLDPTKSKISVAEAARLANEIERGNKSGANLHVLEERGVLVDDSQLDEEDRYGAVIRHEAPPPPPVGRPVIPPPPPPSSASSTSSVGGPVGSASNGGGAAGRAWSRGPPSAPIGIAVDARKEANKVRAQMVVNHPKKASPYGTPKSPLASPLVGNAQKLDALNLNPGVAHVDEHTRREFQQFKANSEKRDAMSLEDMRNFSQQVGSKLSRALSTDKKDQQQPSSSNAAAATTPAPPPPRTKTDSTTTPSTAAAAEPTATTPSSSTKLNPFAKSFSFNFAAKEFKPPTPASVTGGGSNTPGPAVSPARPSPVGSYASGGHGGPGGNAMPNMQMHHRYTPPGQMHNDGGHGGGPGPSNAMNMMGGRGPGMPQQQQRDYDGDGYRRQQQHDNRGGPRDDGRLRHYNDGPGMNMRGGQGQQPGGPIDGMHPPPPPPGSKAHVGSPQGHMQVPGMMPVMAPMMMMGPGGMPGGQTGFFVMPSGGRPAGTMFMPAGAPSYMPGRPMMVPMMAPGGVPMPPTVMGMGAYPAQMQGYPGPNVQQQQQRGQQQQMNRGGQQQGGDD